MMDDYNLEAWEVMRDLSVAICSLSNGESTISSNLIQKQLMEFVKTMPKDDVDLAASRVNKITFSFAPVALVQLYLSPDEGIKECIKQSIQTFVKAIRSLLPEPISSQSVPIVLKLCTLFRMYAANDDQIYKFCRSSLAEMVNRAEKVHVGVYSTLQDTYPFGSSEFVSRISDGLVSSMEPVNGPGPTTSDVVHFRAFLRPLIGLIKDQLSLPIQIPICCKFANLTNLVRFFLVMFDDLLMKLVMCLDTMEDLMKANKGNSGWSQYLMILNELHDISKLYEGKEEYFLKNLRDNKVSLCHLIDRYADRDEDYEWILEHKDLIDFESKRHLIMLLLPEVNEEHDDLHEMLIDRSQLLDESFECIAHADPDCLRVGLAIEFKNEEATGFGVLREWFFLVCQEIFNPKNGLFVACPNDCRRFFPNRASKVDIQHLKYYNFTGRVIALPLMHEVQVGVAFDRSFLLQLAGNKISLEDIKDADPFLYRSCHHILEMDPLDIDQDTLGLTFVWDIQESGVLKVAELCPDGKNITVNSRNRNEYVDLLIRYRFMTSISEQTTHFAQGFTDIVGEERIQKLCFRCLEVEDFDGMLYGNENDIDVQDWKQHTGYNGYLESDPHICWFWEIVEKMSAKQQKVLVFFWTSITRLPVEGFCGLPSRLNIYKSIDSIHHLPSSHVFLSNSYTCLPVNAGDARTPKYHYSRPCWLQFRDKLKHFRPENMQKP